MRSREILYLTKRRYMFAKPAARNWAVPWWLGLALPIALWFGYRQVGNTIKEPQALLVLGGSLQREEFAAKFAKQYPDSPLWISSGSPREYAEWFFMTESGIPRDQLNLDYRAVDTVTNFTSLADELQHQGIHSVYLITSDYHMRRARLIGDIVFGSRGIFFKPIPVPSKELPESPESWLKTVRDGARAILWVTTGHTGAESPQQTKP
jgi:uncharacterized SAM-binding protein YcdF (DUF218 family)